MYEALGSIHITTHLFPEKNLIKTEEEMMFIHSFRGLSLWLLGCLAVGLLRAEHYSREGIVEQGCSPHDSPEAESKTERVTGQESPKGMPHDLFLPKSHFLFSTTFQLCYEILNPSRDKFIV